MKPSSKFVMLLLLAGIPSLVGAQQPERKKLPFDRPAPWIIAKPMEQHGILVITMNLGELRIVHGEGKEIRLEIDPDRFAATPADWVKEFDLAANRARIDLKLPKGDHNGGPVILYVPRQISVKAALGIGEMQVGVLEGDKDLEVGIGQLTVHIGDPKEYGFISASSSLGDVSDSVYEIHQKGLLGKQEEESQRGGIYKLRARVRIGEVDLTGEEAMQSASLY
jgi:hypothetical protein